MDKARKPNQDLSKNSSGLLQGVSRIFQRLSEGFIGSESDFDRRERKDIYSTIATVFEKKFQKPIDVCLGATYILCNESDPKMLHEINQSNLGADGFSNYLKDCIHSILVCYEPITRGKLYNRQVEIKFVKGKRSTTTKVNQEVDWDYLPPDVRERCLRHGEEVSIFEIYTQEK